MLLDTSCDRSLGAARHAAFGPTIRHPLLVTACLLHLALIIGLLVFLRTQGDRWWVGTLLLLVPRWPWLLPLVPLVPWVLWRRRWGLALIVAASAWLTLGPVMGVRASIPANEPKRGDLRILSCNVHREQVNAAELGRVIATVQPDVVALQDWTSANDHLFEGTDWNVRREGELLVASRYPIGDVVVLPLAQLGTGPKAERGAAASFELKTEQGSIYLVNVHLASPHSGLLTFRDDDGKLIADNLERRWDQSAMVRTLVDSLPGPVFLAGDFNTTDDSPIFDEHWHDFVDAFDRCGWGLGLTYVNRTTQIRIDHIMTDRSCWPIRFWMEPAVGSPHRPIVADLAFDPSVSSNVGKTTERATAAEASPADGR
jgi:vancomycin resistance protein VanJ